MPTIAVAAVFAAAYILVYTWTCFVCTVPRQPPMLWAQIALEKELWMGIPTVLQGNIETPAIRLNAVRIRWNNNNRVPGLLTETKYMRLYTSIYTYVLSR